MIRIDAATIFLALLIGILATAFAALLPARRASTTPVVDALRHRI